MSTVTGRGVVTPRVSKCIFNYFTGIITLGTVFVCVVSAFSTGGRLCANAHKAVSVRSNLLYLFKATGGAYSLHFTCFVLGRLTCKYPFTEAVSSCRKNVAVYLMIAQRAHPKRVAVLGTGSINGALLVAVLTVLRPYRYAAGKTGRHFNTAALTDLCVSALNVARRAEKRVKYLTGRTKRKCHNQNYGKRCNL